jgi:hypothetical protein
MASQPTDGDVTLPLRWKEAFRANVSEPRIAEPLGAAAQSGRLREWTCQLTTVVVDCCTSLGWQTAAKGHSLRLLPQIGQEYLGIDAMAFNVAEGGIKWPFPIAVFELENSTRDDRVAYSLWKVLCIRADLRVVFAYRHDWNKANSLVSALREHLLATVPVQQRGNIRGETLLIMGSRSEGESFPWGYFKFWRLNSLWRFEKL